MEKIVLGVDWGTTNSCVSYFKKGEFIVIPNNEGDFISPSVMFFDPYSPEILFGHTASKLTGNLSNLKRLIGKQACDTDLANLFRNNEIVEGRDEISFRIPYNNDTITLGVSELITIYISYLKSYACEFIGIDKNEIIDIVITIPAYYNDSQREIIKDCCEKAKLNVLRIINEPTAAALSYTSNKLSNLSNLKDETILVFDSGGGTTDLSLLTMDYSNQVYEVKSVVGNNFLGGEDITELLTEHFSKKLCDGGFTKFDQKVKNKIKKTCENVKKELSFSLNTSLFLYEQNLQISRAQFINICYPFFQKIRTLINTLVNDTKLKVDKVVFVGGTTRIPHFKEIFNSILGENITIHSELDPDQSVSLGAAVQGALLCHLFEENDILGDTLLMDIIPLSLGIETLGGIMCPIVSRNTPIPVSRTREFTNIDNDTEIDIDIYQGERRLVKDNFFLSSFKIYNEVLQEGKQIIQVTFSIDSDSIIRASAKLKSAKDEVCIKITKESIKTVINKDLEDILLDAENNKLYDSEIGNKILNKIELYDSFKYLLSVFHDKRDIILQGLPQDENFLFLELNNLFNDTFYIIQNFENFTPKELKDSKDTFEQKWHSLLFDSGPIFKDSDGMLIEMGGSCII
jgi:molecular chaperone DnaK (HSP70)